jgi:3-hydroxyisobutyrate dehydrogenase-like beta-hydroxyacid dehydrogenase
MMVAMSAHGRGGMGRLGERPVVGVLHPGAMGAALGSALKARAGVVVWAAAGRSQATSKRAELADLVAVPDIATLAPRCDLIVSICPPHAALKLAEQVADALAGHDRASWPLYLEANAVAPGTVRRIADLFGEHNVVDGAVIGPPAWDHGQSVLWLAGSESRAVAGLFEGSPFEAKVLGAELGQASALKACFALQSKAMPAIWLQLAEAAEEAGVTEALCDELAHRGIDLTAQLTQLSARASTKAWRWAGEMDEAADAMADLGLPDGFSRAAAEVYRRWGDRAT